MESSCMNDRPAEKTTQPIIAGGPWRPPTTLVIGCGNPLRGDDAVGIEVVQRLARCQLPPGVRCIDAGTSGIEVVLLMRNAEKLVLIDAAAPPELDRGQPGRLHQLSADEILGSVAANASATAVSIHAVRWDQALALSQALSGPQPTELTCFLIEGGSFAHGAPLSSAVEAAAEQLVARLEHQLTRPA